MCAVGVAEGDMGNVLRSAHGPDSHGVAMHRRGEVLESLVLPAGADLVRDRVDGDEAGTGEGPDIRAPFFIQSQVPGDDASGPIIQNRGKAGTPEGPIRRKSRVLEIFRAPFGRVHVLFRICSLDNRHR